MNSPRRAYTAAQDAEIIRLREEGRSYADVAELIGNGATAKNLCDRYRRLKAGEPIRERGPYGTPHTVVAPFVKKPPRQILPSKPVKDALCKAFAKGSITRQQLSDGLRGYPVPLSVEA